LTPLLKTISFVFYPILHLLNIPTEASLGIVFAMIRKDGMLLFNQGSGQFLHQLSSFQLFTLVFLASTFSSCMVTITAIIRQMGCWKTALSIVVKQMITSILCICLFAVLICIGL